eukprot:Clim_evm82s218 gene=Clim_evmTU82s218
MDSAIRTRRNAGEMKESMRELHERTQSMKQEKKSDMKAATLIDTANERDLPQIRGSESATQIEQEQQEQRKLDRSDYDEWRKFDVDRELQEIDRREAERRHSEKNDSREKERQMVQRLQYANTLKQRGNECFKRGMFDEAERLYTEALDQTQDSPLKSAVAVFYANRAMARLRMEKFTVAASDCAEALRLDPKYIKAWQRHATAKEKLGDIPAAVQSWRKVLVLEPANINAKRAVERLRGGSSKGTENEVISEEEVERILFGGVKKKPPASCGQANEMHQVSDDQGSPPETLLHRPRPGETTYTAEHGTTFHSVPVSVISFKDNQQPQSTQELAKPSAPVTKSKESTSSSAPVTKRKESTSSSAPVSETVPDQILITKRLPAPPKTAVEFERDWRVVAGDTNLRRSYLQSINPPALPNLLREFLTAELLEDIGTTVEENVEIFGAERSLQYLQGLSQCKRFKTVYLFLSKDAKRVFKLILEKSATFSPLATEVKQAFKL